ncbi:hypothetical protein TAMA11512_02920 [Selenomonas sp. TAMA-11512]|uniref:FemAB family protein n=1 Tax=Selenomonas sp. TAMA-11512 TaxID=3095337 RepID=UPI0030901897|nr:hypothetical protein TAMA11512_02920 [Selenomonas sp. TAMA-11512]
MDFDALREIFRQSFLSSSVKVVFLENGEELWKSVLERLPYVPTNYMLSMLSYQASYMRCFLQELQNFSVVLFDKDTAIGIFPLTLNRKEDGGVKLCTNEGAVYAPLYIASTPEKIIRRYDLACLAAVDALRSHLQGQDEGGLLPWQGQISFLESELYDQMMIWYRILLERGGVSSLSHELYVNLSLPFDEIHKGIRRRYRTLIHKGDKLWDVKVHTAVTHDLFNEFRLLHHRVAGRVTRSLETWNEQEKAIQRGESFLVTLCDASQELIGGALYAISRDEGTYAVGAYRRDLFEQPVSHVAHWRAIRYMKENGLKWYHIGTRFYPSDLCRPTEKELSIAYFKEGFATNMVFHVFMNQ